MSMSNLLIGKKPQQAISMYKKLARLTDLLAQKNLYIIECANPVNWMTGTAAGTW